MNAHDLARFLVRRYPPLYAAVGWETRHRLLGAILRAFDGLRARLAFFGILLLDLGLRILRVELVLPHNTQRIGHLVHEPRAYLIERMLKNRRVRPVFLVNKNAVANRYMLSLWQSRYRFAHCGSERMIGSLSGYARAHPRRSLKYVYSTDNEAKRRSFSEYTGLDTLLDLPTEDLARGERILADIGLAPDAWFVCLHAREGSYLPHLGYHSYRDCDIETYVPAMNDIAAAGGWVFRMGDPSTKPLPNAPRVIDYAHSSQRSDFMDVFLCRRCRLFLGINSGLADVPFLFHQAIAMANVVPFLDSYPGGLVLPKLIYSENEQRFLSFAEVMDRGVHNYFLAENYAQAGLRVVNSEPEDIVALVREMFLKMEGRLAYDEETLRLKQNMDGLFRDGGFLEGACPEISPSFLRRHAPLFRGRASPRRSREGSDVQS